MADFLIAGHRISEEMGSGRWERHVSYMGELMEREKRW